MTAEMLDRVAVEADEGDRPWQRALRRLIRRRTAIFGFGVIVFFILLAILAPLVSPYDPLKTNFLLVRKAPSLLHWFGTDEIGRDVLARVIWGARASLLAGLVSVSLALVVGVRCWGWCLGVLVGGFLDGLLDAARSTRCWRSRFGSWRSRWRRSSAPSLSNAMIAIGISQTPIFPRASRGGRCLSVKHEDYIEAARALGNPHRRIMLRHILPNIVPPILVQATLASAAAIIAEATLSYLGLGQQPPDPSWGSMLNVASHFLSQAPWMAVWPGVAIFLLVLSLNLFGDGLRDALDPRRG